ADQLSLRMATEAEVKWTLHGQRFVHTTTEATKFVHDLFKQHGDDVADLEVRRGSLEDTYMAMVHAFEAGEHETAAHEFLAVTR
ncbi:ABC transporter ATP-binding protein, partial [Kibdelosporangium lantanae]